MKSSIPENEYSHDNTNDLSRKSEQRSGSVERNGKPPFDALSFLLDAQKCDSWNALAELSLGALKRVGGVVGVKWLEVSADTKRIYWGRDHRCVLDARVLTRAADDWRQLLAICQRKSGGDLSSATCVFRLSEKISDIQIRQTGYYQHFMKEPDARDLLLWQVCSSPGGSLWVLMDLDASGLIEADYQSIDFVSQHFKSICQRLAKVCSLTNLANTLMNLRCPGRAVGISVVSNDGARFWEVDHVSRDIITLLGGVTGSQGEISMPVELMKWVKQHIYQHTRLCAEHNEHQHEVVDANGNKIKVSLYVERAGSGALLVLKKEKGGGDFGGLFTRRELDVIQYILEGLPSQEIAEKLTISKRTVDKHLENIYTKLGVSSRISALRSLENMMSS